MRIHISLLLAGLLACSGPASKKASGGDIHTDPSTATVNTLDLGGDPATGDLAALRANVAETMARPEHSAKRVEVAHILIAFQGASRSTQSRSKDEAEALTAELLGKALNGADFTSLAKEYSDDPGGGPYTMSTDGSGGYPRNQMARAFGDTGWRLEVGQIGVAGYSPQGSPFGWHIIKRLQ